MLIMSVIYIYWLEKKWLFNFKTADNSFSQIVPCFSYELYVAKANTARFIKNVIITISKNLNQQY